MSTETTTTPNLHDLAESLKRFTIIDYSIFISMLVSCILIGLYFGREDHKKRKRRLDQDSASQATDYLMGGGNLPIIPVALSLTASLVSGNILLGTATEMYLYGMQYVYSVIGLVLSGVVMHYIIIPVFHDLQITSAYEYLQIRFDKRIRMFGSLLFMIGAILFLPVVIYVPALAFNQTTGINIHIITPIVLFICIFYTCLGGMKAVIWTDVIQIVILFFTILTIAIKGTINVGGFSVVYERNYETGRIQAPDFSIDPTIRHSFWTLVIGYGFLSIAASGINQSCIQRFLALKTIKRARISNFINIIGIITMKVISCYNGLLVFAKYHDCDPLTTGLAKSKDQLLPLMVMQNFTEIPGLAGFFIAGVFAAALSTLSTAYNSMAAVVYEDFFRAYSKKEISEVKAFLIMRGTVLIIGSISVGLVYVVQHMGQILQLTFTIGSTSLGPMLGVFIIGMMIPWIGKRATFYSLLAVYITFLLFVLKTQLQVAKGTISFDRKPTSIEGCAYNFTTHEVLTTTTVKPDEEDPARRGLSYLYFTIFGALLVIILATILSIFFGFDNPKDVNPKSLAPFMRRFFKDHKNQQESNEREMEILRRSQD